MIFGLARVKKFIFDIIFPIECLGCGREGEWLCESCFEKIMPDIHFTRGENLDKIITLYSYNNEIIKKLIHGMKYRFVEELALPIGALLFRELKKVEGQVGKPDFITPVPLHKKRLLERGFNQSELLALKISEYFGCSVEKDVIARSRLTASQVSLDGVGRKENMRDAFLAVDISKILNQKIILIDDVFTTGATMEACARVLKNVGAREVLGLALAKG